MNEEQTSGDPDAGDPGFPRGAWILVALLPAVLIMASMKGGGDAVAFVAFVLNPILSIAASIFLLSRPDRSKVASITGGVFLGVLFAFVNLLVGFFVGCASMGRISP